MSSFLVNLARRSAGLGPIVRARSVPALPESDLSPEAAAEAKSVPVALAPTPSPVVQRASAASPATPATRSTPIALAEDSQPVATRLRMSVNPVPRERSAPSIEPSSDVVARPIAPAMFARIDPTDESRHEQHQREVLRVDSRIIERVIERATSDAPEAIVVRIQPAETRGAIPAAPLVQSTPERIVHVRIGAIEIHGANVDPGAQPSAATAPSVSATPASAASPAGGFDDYAALRSYAPWTW